MSTLYKRNDRVVFSDKCRRVTPGTSGVVTGSTQGFYQVFAAEADKVINVRAAEISLQPEEVEEASDIEREVKSSPDLVECPKGHPYDEENTYVNPQGYKVCRICKRASISAAQKKRRARAKAEKETAKASRLKKCTAAAQEAVLDAPVEETPVEAAPAPTAKQEPEWQIGDAAILANHGDLVKIVALGAPGHVVVELKDGDLEKVHTSVLQRPIHAKIYQEADEIANKIFGSTASADMREGFSRGYAKALRDLALDREPTVSLLRELQL